MVRSYNPENEFGDPDNTPPQKQGCRSIPPFILSKPDGHLWAAPAAQTRCDEEIDRVQCVSGILPDGSGGILPPVPIPNARPEHVENRSVQKQSCTRHPPPRTFESGR